jgi:hypothetical protein
VQHFLRRWPAIDHASTRVIREDAPFARSSPHENRRHEVGLTLALDRPPAKGPGRSLPRPDAGHPLHGAGGHGGRSQRQRSAAPKDARTSCSNLDEEHPRVDHAAEKTRRSGRDQPVQATTGLQHKGEPATPTSAAVITVGRTYRRSGPLSPRNRDGLVGLRGGSKTCQLPGPITRGSIGSSRSSALGRRIGTAKRHDRLCGGY